VFVALLSIFGYFTGNIIREKNKEKERKHEESEEKKGKIGSI
jgi:hypothetical protein